jgi:hypothetical protein
VLDIYGMVVETLKVRLVTETKISKRDEHFEMFIRIFPFTNQKQSKQSVLYSLREMDGPVREMGG